MILVGNTILQGHEGAAVHQIVADMSHKLKGSKKVEKGWKVLNVLHRVCKNPRIMPHGTPHPIHWLLQVCLISFHFFMYLFLQSLAVPLQGFM